jgi:hypothetical protein
VKELHTEFLGAQIFHTNHSLCDVSVPFFRKRNHARIHAFLRFRGAGHASCYRRLRSILRSVSRFAKKFHVETNGMIRGARMRWQSPRDFDPADGSKVSLIRTTFIGCAGKILAVQEKLKTREVE